MNGILNLFLMGLFTLFRSSSYPRSKAIFWGVAGVLFFLVTDYLRALAYSEDGGMDWAFVLTGFMGSFLAAIIGIIRSTPDSEIQLESQDLRNTSIVVEEHPADDQPNSDNSVAERLDRLKNLLQTDRITEEEYQRKRAEILSNV